MFIHLQGIRRDSSSALRLIGLFARFLVFCRHKIKAYRCTASKKVPSVRAWANFVQPKIGWYKTTSTWKLIGSPLELNC